MYALSLLTIAQVSLAARFRGKHPKMARELPRRGWVVPPEGLSARPDGRGVRVPPMLSWMPVERRRCAVWEATEPEVARLRVVVRRLYDLGEQRRALDAEAAALELERRRLLEAVAGTPAPGSGPEWRPAVVRSLLLGLGSVLVALAALIFAAVTWVRLDDLGRAGLLAAVTLAAWTAAAAARRRLPATGEALGGLALALLLVDWYALRRAGVGGGLSIPAWWALGSATAAAVAATAGRWLPLQRPAAAVLAQVSGLLLVVELAAAPWTVAMGLAVVAAASVAVAARLLRVAGWRQAAGALVAGATVLDLAAVLTLLLGTPSVADLADAVGPAMALVAVALAPAVARAALPGRSAPARHGLVAASAGGLLAAAGTLLTSAWTSWSLAAAIAVLGASAVAVARPLPHPLRLGATLAACATLATGLLGLADPILRALSAPTAWLDHPWTSTLATPAAEAVASPWPFASGPEAAWPAVIGLLAAAGAALAAGPARSPEVGRWRAAAGAAAAVGSVAVLPVAAGWSLGTTLALSTAAAFAAGTGAVLLDRRTAHSAVAVLVGAAVALLLVVVPWALATEAGTLGLLAVLAPAAAVGVSAARSGWLRQVGGGLAAAAVVGAAAAAVAAAGGDAARVGLAVTAAGGLVLGVGAWWRRGAPEGVVAEVAGPAGLVLGVALATDDQRWLAASLTVAVPSLLLAAVGSGRRGHLWAAMVVATAATWAWLAVADVTLPEAYVLPAAAAALAAGLAARRGPLRPGSWLAYGPGLALALLPSLVLAVDDPGLVRPLLLSGGALAVLLAGARARLQAPLVLGAGTLVGLAADAALPVAAQLPRWVSVGGAGLLLLWLGATAERRLARLRQLRHQLAELEPGAGAPNAG
jgi:hypothetical protein